MDYVDKPITIRLAIPNDASEMAEIHMRSWEVAYCGEKSLRMKIRHNM